jgi:hypothetical protein
MTEEAPSMRTILALFLLTILLPTAQATPITIFGAKFASFKGDFNPFQPTPPQPIAMRAGTTGTDPQAWAGLTIPDVQADDPARILNYRPDDGLGRSWVITSANAAAYGLDWEAFEAKLSGIDARLSLNLGTEARFFRPAFSDLEYIADFQMERIEIAIVYWFWHPVLETLRAYRIEGRIFGDGQILPIPEPTAWSLALMAASAIVTRRQRGRYAQPG